MLSREPVRVDASSPYCAARSHFWRSGPLGTEMSAAQSRRQAAAFAASTPDQPRRAARREASRAEARGSGEVSAVSTPTYFSKVYVRPARTRCVLRAATGAPGPGPPERTVWTIAPLIPVPRVRNVP